MKLFLDTADVAQIREAWNWGIIDGVTTNPTHVAKAGRKPLEVYREIGTLLSQEHAREAIMQASTPHEVIKVIMDITG